MHDFMKQFKATALAKSKGGSEAEQVVLDLSQMETSDFENDPHMLKVCKFGINALPYLAAEIESERLTKCFVPSYGKNQEMIVPVNYVAKILVGKLSGFSMGLDKMTKNEVLNLYRIEKLKLGKSSDTIAKSEKNK